MSYPLSGYSLNVGHLAETRKRLRAALPPVPCDRCGVEADADAIDVSTFAEGPRSSYIFGRITCVTPGCVDEYGSTAVEPPDVPGELTREDRRWLRRQREFLEEYERVTRLFETEMARL